MSISKELFFQAKQIVVSTGNYSPAYLQRKLAIGYSRAVVLQDMIRRCRYMKNYRYRRFVSKKRKNTFK